MKLFILLILLASCNKCPTKVGPKCLSESPMTTVVLDGNGGFITTITYSCDKYSEEIYVNYECREYLLGKEVK